jgi:hypothetical protein
MPYKQEPGSYTWCEDVWVKCLSFLCPASRLKASMVCSHFKALRFPLGHVVFVGAESNRSCPYLCDDMSLKKNRRCDDMLVIYCRPDYIFSPISFKPFSRINTVEFIGFNAQQFNAPISTDQWGKVENLNLTYCSSIFVESIVTCIERTPFYPRGLSVEGSRFAASTLFKPIFQYVVALNLDMTETTFDDVCKFHAICRSLKHLSIKCTPAMTTFVEIEYDFVLERYWKMVEFRATATMLSIQKMLAHLKRKIKDKNEHWDNAVCALLWESYGSLPSIAAAAAALLFDCRLDVPGHVGNDTSLLCLILVQPRLQLGSGKQPLLELFLGCGGLQDDFESHMTRTVSPLHAACRGLSGNGSLTLTIVSELLSLNTINPLFSLGEDMNATICDSITYAFTSRLSEHRFVRLILSRIFLDNRVFPIRYDRHGTKQRTYLHDLATVCHVTNYGRQIANFLINIGCSVTAVDINGVTPDVLAALNDAQIQRFDWESGERFPAPLSLTPSLLN